MIPSTVRLTASIGGGDGLAFLSVVHRVRCRGWLGDLDGYAMNPDRFDAFAEAYVVAVRDAVTDLSPHLCGKTVEVFALDSALIMLAMLQDKGIQSIEHYVLNTRGGAFRRTAEQLGIDPSAKALQHYLEGV